MLSCPVDFLSWTLLKQFSLLFSIILSVIYLQYIVNLTNTLVVPVFNYNCYTASLGDDLKDYTALFTFYATPAQLWNIAGDYMSSLRRHKFQFMQLQH